ncbi:deoxyribose-phosphate aldolase [Humidisolicoccus flavus]|uniref:deoxyribose-phosphate aldolase n=1 Tax=Humidisolicoccus flavus TaxID=3111414 RepID=UPI00324A071F
MGDIAARIDHTLLKPNASAAEVDVLVDEAIEHGFASVCINSVWVPRARARFDEAGISGAPLVCTVVGFPLGASTSETKAFEAKLAVEQGAGEVDMVVDIAAVQAGDADRVEADIAAVVAPVHAGGALLKVIIETCLLTDEQKVLACEAAVRAGADFVKTSTGFNGPGANVHDVALMRGVVGDKLGVKASGGVRTLEDYNAMVEAGASRIGASAGIAIVAGSSNAGEGY